MLLRIHNRGRLDVDECDGRAWLGIIPFHMTDVSARGLNVRTYVTAERKPGVWFFSLDAARGLAVACARAFFNLPYFKAAMDVTVLKDAVSYESRRRHAADGRGELSGQYAPAGVAFQAAPGSLEYFLTERYCLYGLSRRGRVYRLEIHHPPWQLRTAEASFRRNTMAEASGIALPSTSPLLHFSPRQDMVAWAPEMLNAAEVGHGEGSK